MTMYPQVGRATYCYNQEYPYDYLSIDDENIRNFSLKDKLQLTL